MFMKKTGSVLVCLLSMTSLSMTGCNESNKIIKKVDVKVSENMEILTVTMTFHEKIQMDLEETFDLKQYGSVFMRPWTEERPLQIGLDLNTAIMNDQDYVQLAPVTTLPNGMPIGLPGPVVEIRGENPINPKFDIFAYADVLDKKWLGVAAMFKFIDPKYISPGLTVVQVFKRDDQQRPVIMGSVYGPVIGDDGSVTRSGGVAVFANAKDLVAQMAGATEVSFPALP